MEMLNEPYAQKEWGAKVALDFFLGGSASSLVAFYLVNLSASGASYELGTYLSILSLAFLLGGLVLLASEMGRPSNLWRSTAKFRKSWMARGSVFNLALLVTLCFLAASFVFRAPPIVAYPVYVFAVVLSLMVSLYPGMLLHSVRDIKSWRSSFQPPLSLAEAASSGLGLLVLVTVFSGSSVFIPVMEALSVSTLSLIFAIVFLSSLGRSSLPGAKATYSKLVSARDGLSFYPFITIGCALPIGCFLFALLVPNWAGARPVAALGAGSLLAGNIIYRFMLLLHARHEPMTLLHRNR
jgi:formate-dependent nitrite reductase membrane component NrfD